VLSADAVAAIRGPGARHVDTAAAINQALKSIERASPSFAVFDINNLGAERSGGAIPRP